MENDIYEGRIMSSIYAYDDFKTQNWKIETYNIASNYVDLYIGFTDDAPIIEFDNLQFGFTISKGEENVKIKNYPENGIIYVNTDQPFLEVERINLEPNTIYSLYIWAENASIKIENNFEFVTPPV
jgi:hypothetical protein